jgi:osmotically-inducible protein OsmY
MHPRPTAPTFYGGQPRGMPEPRTLRGPHAGKGPKGYKRSDERIREDVCERLTDHHDVDATDIEVTVENGEVTLSGLVGVRRDKLMAEHVAEGVSGVFDIHNEIRVRREGAPSGKRAPLARDTTKS